MSITAKLPDSDLISARGVGLGAIVMRRTMDGITITPSCTVRVASCQPSLVARTLMLLNCIDSGRSTE